MKEHNAMVDEDELVATERGAMIVWILVKAGEEPVPVAVLAEKVGVSYAHMRKKLLLKLERRLPIKWHMGKPVRVSLPK